VSLVAGGAGFDDDWQPVRELPGSPEGPFHKQPFVSNHEGVRRTASVSDDPASNRWLTRWLIPVAFDPVPVA